MEFSAKLEGEQQLIKVFAKLPKATRRRAINPAMRKGATYVKDLAQVYLNSVLSGRSTGLLQRSLTVYMGKRYQGNNRFIVQVKKGLVNTKKIVNGSPVRVGMYAAVLEYGKKDGSQPPRSWIRRASREGKGQAITIVTQEIGKNISLAVSEAKK